jgi:phospholipid/cholesterol/gamma-HCH transport system permease protein
VTKAYFGGIGSANNLKERDLAPLLGILAVINRGLKKFALESQGLFFFSGRMLGALRGRPLYVAETMEQMYLIGVGSLYLVVLTGLSAGQGFALAFSNELADFGAKDYIGRIMAIAITRELGPTLTGLMVAARVAAGITAEIGAMKASNQLDAMVAFGIDPIKKIAVPRLISLIVMVPALTIVCDMIAILGGWIISQFISHVSSTVYWTGVRDKLIFGNMFMGILKPLIFSFVIAFISCYKGFSSEGGTKGVGQSTTNSVVLTSISILVVNFFLTKLVYSLIKGYL